jgi:3-phosphoshikimate 1-carboxyvinyltransferase
VGGGTILSMSHSNEESISVQFLPSPALQGTIQVPGDKSITHRAILFGLLAHGITHVSGWLDAEDCRSSLRVAQQLGARVVEGRDGLSIEGTGGTLQAPADALDCGNSGTTMRLLLGPLAAKVPFACVTGDGSLRKRPMQRVLNPLRQMGASLVAEDNAYAPIRVTGQPLRGIEYRLPVASAQVKSALLLAGLLAAEGTTTVVEPVPTRDHTESMLSAFGAELHTDYTPAGRRLSIRSGQRLNGIPVSVPGDASSAAFLLAAAAIVPDSRITIAGVGLNPTRTGLLHVMARMGIHLDISNLRTIGGEAQGDVTVRHGVIRGVTITGDEVPSLIDELPIIAVLAAFAEGETHVTGAEELRVKETDRITAIVTGLQAIGVNVEERHDGFLIHGQSKVQGGRVDSFGDHRIAMSFAVAGCASETGVQVEQWSAVNISYPTFAASMSQLGAKWESV